MRVENARELEQVVAAVGLAQNLAALRALVTDGIQRGHMKLQLRSLAVAVGADADEVAAVVQAMQAQHARSSQQAREILQEIRQKNERK